MNFADLIKTMQEVSYPGYQFWAVEEDDNPYAIYATYDEADTVTGKMEEQETRHWIIPDDYDKSQVVQTAFKCLLTSLEHRGREWFLYRGKSVFGPHFDVDTLWTACTAREQDAWKEGK